MTEIRAEPSDERHSGASAAPGRSRYSLRTGLEAVLFLSGAACLSWVAWAVADAGWYQHRAVAELARTARVPAAEAAIAPKPDPGTPLARLEIPRLDVSVVVAEGTSPGVLRRAVGRLRSSALLGTAGHAVLAGHRDTFFRPLEEIEVGDLIVLAMPGGREQYLVDWVQIVEPSDIWVLEDPAEPALTLVTCFPFRFVGDAPRRFVVRARALDAGGAERAASGALAAHLHPGGRP